MKKQLLLILTLLIIFVTQAQTTFTYTGNGNWTDQGNWSPSYPGLIISETDTVVISSFSQVFFIENELINNGTISIEEQSVIEVYANLINNGTINTDYYSEFNYSGNIDIIDEQQLINSGTINNKGRFFKRGKLVNYGMLINVMEEFEDAMTVFINVTIIENNGEISNSSGFINEANGIIVNNGVINELFSGFINYGDILGINISHNGNFFNYGNISPGIIQGISGRYTLNENMICGESSGISITLKDTSNSPYNNILIDNELTLNGNLTVFFESGFTPNIGDTYAILTANSIVGTFNAINIFGLTEDRTTNVSQTGDSIIIEIEAVLGEDNFQLNKYNIYPNPTTKTLSVQGLKDSYSNIDIYNITGQKVWREKVSQYQNTIDVSQLATGIYFLKINTDTIKFIKK